MGRVTIEQALLAAKLNQLEGNVLFVEQVMGRLEGAVIFSSVVRTTNEQHNYRGALFMKTLRTLPIGVLVAIIIGAAAVTGAAAYAVYKTIIEPLTVHETHSVIEDGKQKTTFTVEGCPSYDGVSQAEITTITGADTSITNNEVRKYVIARCELNAIAKYAHDVVAASGVALYDSSVLYTNQPVAMPTEGADMISLDAGQRRITKATEFYKDGQLVNRSAIPTGSLVHAAYGGVASKASPDVLAIVAASVDARYYAEAYDIGPVLQRVPCRNNQAESCLSNLPGRTFYTALSADTGPIPAGEERYAEAIMNKTYIELGGVVTFVDGNTLTFRASTGRNVTFYLPDDRRVRAPEQALPGLGTEIIVTTIGKDRDVITPSDLLSAYIPIISE